MRAFATTRRGRPRRVAANDNAHEANGRDLGTPEAQLKRAALAQGADPVAVTHPLDLLLARGLIDGAMHRAGWRYAGLYRRVIGRTDVSYGRLYDGLRGEAQGKRPACQGDDDLAAAQAAFRQAQANLRAEGPVVAGITERLAVFGAWPDWLQRRVTAAHRELGFLRCGLARLTQTRSATDRAKDDLMTSRPS